MAPPRPEPKADERTVGQLIAEAIRLYQRTFWRSLALGIPPTVFLIGAALLDEVGRLVFAVIAGSILLASAYTAAVILAARSRGRVVPALLAAVVALLPLAASRAFVFPGIYFVALAWFALFGLAVPAVLVEGRPLRDSFGRGLSLARADFVHVFGAVAALAIVSIISIFALSSLLAGFGEQSLAIAAFLAILVISPVFFLGSALLYFDQAARHHGRHGAALP